MRTIDANRLLEERRIHTYYHLPNGDIAIPLIDIKNAPTIEPERKTDTIQKFHDYQVEWLLSHCDLELEPQLEEWIVRFLHDTANCYMMEIDRKEGDTP